MRRLKVLTVCALAFFCLYACTDKVETDIGDVRAEDAGYAASASVSSDDPCFTATEAGGAVSFQPEGGETLISVECGTYWIARNYASDIFDATANVSAGILVISAGQNYLSESLAGTIELRTASSEILFATISVTQDAYTKPDISVETNSLRLPAVGELTVTVAVQSSLEDWEADTDCAWLAVEKTESGVSIVAQENPDAEERDASVVITSAAGVRVESQTIWVTQDAKAYVSTSADNCTFFEDAGSISLTVDSNYDWECSCGEGGWYTAQKSGDRLTVTVTDNESDDEREGAVTITAGDGAENVAEILIAVIQYGPRTDALVLEYSISAANSYTTICLPIAGSVDCTVSWGDGETEQITSAYPYHTYTTGGDYSVWITGTVTALNSGNITVNYKRYLASVRQWGATGLTSMEDAFYYCPGLESVPDDSSGAFSDVTTFKSAFYYTPALTSVPAGLFSSVTGDTSFQNTFWGAGIKEIPENLFAKCAAVTTFEGTFRGCVITDIPENLFSNCAAVTSFANVFTDCDYLTSVPAGLFANCPNVTSFWEAFEYDSALTEIPEGLFDNNAKAENFGYTFEYCTSLESIPKGLFANCPSATSFFSAFNGCSALKGIPEGGLFSDDLMSAEFTWIFASCTSLETAPADLFANCAPAVNSIGRVFSGCTSLKEIPEEIFSGCVNVDNCAYAFYQCASLTEIPAGLFSDCSGAASFDYAFEGCTALTSIPAGLFSNCKAVTNFQRTFYGCSALEGESTYDEIEIDGETVKIHLYERAAYADALGCAVPESYSGCFNGCTGLSDYDAIAAAGWK